MIIYLLLKLILFVLGIISNLFGSLIPDFPTVLSDLLTDISTMIDGGISFVSYFFFWPVLVSIIAIFISYHSFKVIKDVVMKVIGHFIAN